MLQRSGKANASIVMVDDDSFRVDDDSDSIHSNLPYEY
jgi:hypothetical protein